MRLVLDTNVVVSALVWGGVPYRLIEAAAAGDVELVTSPALLAELRDVLGRQHLASRLAQQRSSVEQAIGLYAELAISVSPLVSGISIIPSRGIRIFPTHLLQGASDGTGTTNA